MFKMFIHLIVSLALSLLAVVANAGTWSAVQDSASLVSPYPTTVQVASGMNLPAIGSSHGHPNWSQLTTGGSCVTGTVHYFYTVTVLQKVGATWRGYMRFKKQVCN